MNDAPNSHLDATDLEILDTRVALRDLIEIPREGDYVEFSDGKCARISMVHSGRAQTSADGSWYMGRDYISFSGALDPGVPLTQLNLTTESRPGRFWFFHHDVMEKGGGVNVMIPCRVYRTSLVSTFWHRSV